MAEDKNKDRLGHQIKYFVGGEHYNAYIPKDLPPKPPLNVEELYPLLDQANIALGRLDGMSMVLPDHSLFLYMYVRKEAVLSSQIEGTQSSLSDLLLFENEEAPGAPVNDVQEVSNYVAAMHHGLERLKDLPLSLRLIREIHEKLMTGTRGGNKMPGEFRSSQNWIGGTRPGNAFFVPPPPERLMDTLGAFEKFLHDENTKMPTLVKAALAHHQFETIHPFLDGNGRVGRLMNTEIPVILVTSLDDAVDKVSGLELGADDYVIKPFDGRELIARARAVLRRTRAGLERKQRENEADKENKPLRGWTLNLDMRTLVHHDGVAISLSDREMLMVAFMQQQAGKVVPRETLSRHVYRREWTAEDRALDNLVTRLRRKIETNTASPVNIITVRNQGFMFPETFITKVVEREV